MVAETVVIFCENQNEINLAVQRWVNEEGFKRVYTSSVKEQALHYLKIDSGYRKSECTPYNLFKHVVLFEK
ncbi:MAG: hypothetical protein KDI92_00255 [Xanthomonadales bacterium]|nr:hypothetical protein [Xanthomonadales bacterium]